MLTSPLASALDDLGTPLSQVTFVVVDLETTGGSPRTEAITEIGALRLRGGELLGTFETLVNPGVPIPPFITVLTGISEAMVLPAPRIAEVLPAFLEFARDAVIVGHNIRFDCSFLDAALLAQGYPRLSHRRVDTFALARRLVRDELPNLKLHTLADHFRTSVEPVHRAYADAAATAEVLHALIERAAAFGVLGLDDLLAVPTMRPHPSTAKLALTAKLPRLPGIYLFRDRADRVLFVGKAKNLRARVRSYFHTKDRRQVPQLLRETYSVEHRVCAGPFEAAIRELRLIQRLEPRFNRQSKSWRRYTYLKLTAERTPRLIVTRVMRADGAYYLGPFRSSAAATQARAAVEAVVCEQECTKIAIEEAALIRDRVTALTRALRRRRAMDAIRAAGRVVVDSAEGRVELLHGRVVLAEDDPSEFEPPDLDLPPTREVADELLLVSRWLEQTKGVRCEFASGIAASRIDLSA